MNKLKNKVFCTIFLILSITLLTLTVAFNFQKYFEEKKNIINALDSLSNVNKDNKMPPPNDEFNSNIRFLDSDIYTVLVDENNNIKEVINHSNKDIDDTLIEKKATKILKSGNIRQEYVGCLYFSNYSYRYFANDSLLIFDNSNVRLSLFRSLIISILIFLILEAVAFILSRAITDWIIIPVKSSFEKQKQFIADASHELKTPLSVILASSEALEENPAEVKWIKNIQNEASRMGNLISNLLDLAATEEKKIENIKYGNLSKAIELSVLTFEVKAFEKNIKLKYDIEENINTKFDYVDIRQLVEILFDNAIKHSKPNHNIYVTLKTKENQILLKVINEGSKIPKGEEEKIFERFYRIDKSRNRDENRYGLGLAIAKNIVENHNGKISANSNNNQTTFLVILKK